MNDHGNKIVMNINSTKRRMVSYVQGLKMRSSRLNKNNSEEVQSFIKSAELLLKLLKENKENPINRPYYTEYKDLISDVESLLL